MMIVGNYGNGKATGGGGKYKGMSDLEYQTHMSLWCILNAPLLSSCDLRSMNEPTKNILLNSEIISINQDEKGEQAKLISKMNGVWVYKKNLSDNSFVLAVFNNSRNDVNRGFSREELTGSKYLLRIDPDLSAYDVWQHRWYNEKLKEKILLMIKAHETLVLKFRHIGTKID